MRLIHGSLFLFLSILFAAPSSAQTDSFQPILSYGRGVPQNASWRPNGNIVLVNSITGAWLYSGDDLTDIAHFENLRDAAFSPDGRWLVGANDQDETELRDSSSFEIVALPEGFRGTNFSPDGRWLLGERDGKPVLLDATSFTPIDLPADYVDQAPAYSIWSPDSLKLLAVSDDNSLTVWRIGDAAPQFSIQPDINNYPQWSPDSGKISLNDPADNRVQIWDAHTGVLLLELPAQDREVDDEALGGWVSWKPDGNQLLRFYPSNESVTVQIYDANTGILIDELFSGQAFYIWFSPDGEGLAFSFGLYDMDTYEKIADFFAQFTLAWSPDSRWIAIPGLSQPQIDILDGVSGKLIHRLNGHLDGFASKSVSWSPDSTKLLSWDDRGQFILWDTLTGNLIARMDNHVKLGFHAVFSFDGKLMAIADSIGKVRLWNLQTGELIKTITDHLGEVDTLLWQPGGKLLVTQNARSDTTFWDGIDDRNVIYIWDGETGALVHTIRGQSGLASATWRPDGKQLLVGNEGDNSVVVWDAAANDESTMQIQIGGFITHPEISWSPNQQILLLDYYVASHGGHAIRLYDTLTQEILANQIRYVSPVSYTWTQDSQKLLFASTNCSVNTNNRCSVSIRTVFDRSKPPLDAPRDYYFDVPIDFELGTFAAFPSLFWSPNGKWLATLAEGNMQLWDIERKMKASLSRNVQSMNWSPDGGKFTILLNSGTAKVIGLTTGSTDMILNDVSAVNWLPDSTLIRVYKQDNQEVWNAETGKLLRTLPNTRVQWSPDGNIYVDFSDWMIRVWARE